MAKKKSNRGPGKPPSFDSVEELEEKIEAYFAHCEKGKIIKTFNRKLGEMVEQEVEYPRTIEGLSVYLGITRMTLLNYSKDSDYFYTISRAKERILAWKTESAWMGTADPRVWQFDLQNNHGYKKEQSTEIKMSSEVIKPELPEDE